MVQQAKPVQHLNRLRWFFSILLIGEVVVFIYSLTFGSHGLQFWKSGLSLFDIFYWLTHLVILIGSGFLLAKTWGQTKLRGQIEALLARQYFVDSTRYYTIGILSLVCIVLVSGLIYFAVNPDFPNTTIPGLLMIGFRSLYGLIIFLILWLVLFTGFFSFNLFQLVSPENLTELRNKNQLSPQKMAVNTIALFLTVIATIYFLFVLFLVITRTPLSPYFRGWFFDLRQPEPPINLLKLVLVVGGFSSLLLVILLRQKRYIWLSLFLMGVIFQFAFPLIEDGSLNRIEYRVRRRVSGNYNTAVCMVDSYKGLFENYEVLAEENPWIATKPAGFLVPQMTIKEIIGLISPQKLASEPECRTALWTTLKFLLPVIAMLSFIPLFFISRHFFSVKHTYYPALTFILVPSTILFTGMPDQSLITLMFIPIVLFSINTTAKSSIPLAALTGLWYFICFNYSYSLAGSLAFPLLWIIFDFWINRAKRSIKTAILLATVVIGTTVLCILVAKWLTGYDTINLFLKSAAYHRQLMKIRPSGTLMLENFWLNNSEFIMWIGPPTVMMLFGSILLKKNKTADPVFDPKAKQTFLWTLFAFYLLINLAGQNRAEVARLWMFMNPLFAIAATLYIPEIEKRNKPVILGSYLVLQLLLIYLYNQPFITLFETDLVN